MKQFIRARRTLMVLLAAVMLLACTVGLHNLGAAAAANYTVASGSILENVPLYTYEGTYVQTYDMSADGQYYEADGTTKFSTPVTDALGGGEMLVFKSVSSAAAMEQYENDLEEAGYMLYAENDLGGNLYATWVTDEYVVTLTYLPNWSQFNILVEPMRALPGLEEENVYKNLEVDNKVILLTCGYIGNANGMCVIYQLCDGSFIIEDSGYGYGYHTKAGYEDYWQNQAKEIYSTLEKLAKESGVNDIVIAAWFFSHPHWDHIGGFIPFADLYADQVKLEKVIFNWPNYDTLQQMIVNPGQKMNHYIDVIEESVEKFDGADIVESHAGQTYYIRDAVIDVLCTWELQTEWSDSWVSVNEGNAISQILDIKLGSERIIMLGDSGISSTATTEQLYSADFLEADFLQVAHHGYNGSFTKNLNEMVNPDVVLWPNDTLSSANLAKNFAEIPEEIYYHNRQITVIPLPYTGEENVEYWSRVYPVK